MIESKPSCSTSRTKKKKKQSQLSPSHTKGQCWLGVAAVLLWVGFGWIATAIALLHGLWLAKAVAASADRSSSSSFSTHHSYQQSQSQSQYPPPPQKHPSTVAVPPQQQPQKHHLHHLQASVRIHAGTGDHSEETEQEDTGTSNAAIPSCLHSRIGHVELVNTANTANTANAIIRIYSIRVVGERTTPIISSSSGSSSSSSSSRKRPKRLRNLQPPQRRRSNTTTTTTTTTYECLEDYNDHYQKSRLQPPTPSLSYNSEFELDMSALNRFDPTTLDPTMQDIFIEQFPDYHFYDYDPMMMMEDDWHVEEYYYCEPMISSNDGTRSHYGGDAGTACQWKIMSREEALRMNPQDHHQFLYSNRLLPSSSSSSSSSSSTSSFESIMPPHFDPLLLPRQIHVVLQHPHPHQPQPEPTQYALLQPGQTLQIPLTLFARFPLIPPFSSLSSPSSFSSSLPTPQQPFNHNTSRVQEEDLWVWLGHPHHHNHNNHPPNSRVKRRRRRRRRSSNLHLIGRHYQPPPPPERQREEENEEEENGDDYDESEYDETEHDTEYDPTDFDSTASYDYDDDPDQDDDQENDHDDTTETKTLFQVIARVVIDSSEGVLEVPLEVTSVRTNPYGLPDRIVFDHVHPSLPVVSVPDIPVPVVEEPFRRRVHTSRSEQGTTERSRRVQESMDSSPIEDDHDNEEVEADDCYDLYIQHPHASKRDDNDNDIIIDDNYDDADNNDGGDGDDDEEEEVGDEGDDVEEEEPEDLKVTEIFVSHPQFVHLYIDPAKQKGTIGKGHNIMDVNHNKKKNKKVETSSFIHSWRCLEEQSACFRHRSVPMADAPPYPLTVTATGSNKYFYMATICPRRLDSLDDEEPLSSSSSSAHRHRRRDYHYPSSAPWIQLTSDEYQSNIPVDYETTVTPSHSSVWMGYLTIVTNFDSLYIPMERQYVSPTPLNTSTTWPLIENDRDSTSSDLNVRNHTISTPAASSSFSPTLHSFVNETNSRLSALPAVMDVHIVSSVAAAASLGARVVLLGIHYNSTQEEEDSPIMIRRVSALYSIPPELSTLGFSVNIEGATWNEPRLIHPRQTVHEMLQFDFVVDWERYKELPSHLEVEFVGTIIVRASSFSDWDYEQWEAALHENPSLIESDLVVEVPFRVKILNGTIGPALETTSHPDRIFWSSQQWDGLEMVTAAFFPASQDGIRASLAAHQSTDLFNLRKMELRLRIYTDIDLLTRIQEIKIVHDALGSNESSEMATLHTSLCHHFSVAIFDDAVKQSQEFDDKVELGVFKVSYTFPNSSMVYAHDQTVQYPLTCYLQLTTEPDTGNHFLPLIIYTGHLDVSGSEIDPGSLHHPSDVDDEYAYYGDDSGRYIILSGFEQVLPWMLKAKSGASFRDMLGLGSKSWTDAWTLLVRYLSGLTRNLVNKKVKPYLFPILIQAGAISHGEVELLPLFVTNPNPVSIEISIDVGEVEGMSITLGRDILTGQEDADLLNCRSKNSHEHGDGSRRVMEMEPLVHKNDSFSGPENGLRHLLLKDENVATFLAKFPFRAAISLSAAATARLPLLQTLFDSLFRAEFHKYPDPQRFSPKSWSRCENSVHPPHYGHFETSLESRNMQGPVIVSSGDRLSRRLPVCWDRDGEPDSQRYIEDMNIHLPPGSVARFDIKLRVPSYSVLTKDITPFLATGLVLSSSHGETMPILVSFEALHGKLDLSHIPSLQTIDETDREGVIQVPMKLFDIAPNFDTNNNSSSIDGTSLFIKSSFSRDVKLREVVSCNPLFELTSHVEFEPEVHPTFGVKIGEVVSKMSCDSLLGLSSDEARHPSYFRCMLNWLVNHADLQPLGCGTVRSKGKTPTASNSSTTSSTGGVDRTINAIERALAVSEFMYGPFDEAIYFSGKSRLFKRRFRAPLGVTPEAVVDAIANAYDSWYAVSNNGLRTLSTSMRAVVEYNNTNGGEHLSTTATAHNVSLPFRKLTIESKFRAPILFDAAKARLRNLNASHGTDDSPGFIVFPPTRIASVSSISIPLRNPTAVPVNVRLSAARLFDYDEAKPWHHPAKSVFDVEETARTRFLRNIEPPFIQNAKFRQIVQRQTLPHNEWWDEVGGFYFSDFDGDIIRSQHNVTIIAGADSVVGLYNPSLSASFAYLKNCIPSCSINELISARLSSTMGAAAAVGSTIQGQRRSKPPRLHERGTQSGGGSVVTSRAGPSAFAVPFASLDEKIIPPFGEVDIGPILFRPMGRFPTIGCRPLSEIQGNDDCKLKPFQALVLLENSLNGLERIILSGRGQIERIDFVDPIPNVNSEFGSIELRHGRPTLFFSEAHLESPSNVKEAVILNSGDIPIKIKSVHLTLARNDHSVSECELDSFRIVNCHALNDAGFTLAPGENRSVFVELARRCTNRKDYVILTVDIDRSHRYFSVNQWERYRYDRSNAAFDSSARDEAELMIGYEMTRRDFSICKKESYKNKGKAIKLNPEPKGADGTPPYAMYLVSMLTILIPGSVLINLASLRIRSASRFHRILNLVRPTLLRGLSKPLSGAKWLATFRYLARADPSSQDLLSLAREQTRHLVLDRYRSCEVHQPHCIGMMGSFHRDKLRPEGQGLSNKEGNGRNKTLSESLFNACVPSELRLCRLPCNLGWKTAYMRRIIDDETLADTPIVFKTKSLLLERQRCIDDDDLKHLKEESSKNDDILSSDGSSASSSSSSTEDSDLEAPEMLNGFAQKPSASIDKSFLPARDKSYSRRRNTENSVDSSSLRSELDDDYTDAKKVTPRRSPIASKSGTIGGGGVTSSPRQRRLVSDSVNGLGKHQLRQLSVKPQPNEQFAVIQRSLKAKPPADATDRLSLSSAEFPSLTAQGKKDRSNQLASSKDPVLKKTTAANRLHKGNTNKEAAVVQAASSKNVWRSDVVSDARSPLRHPFGLSPPPGFGGATAISAHQSVMEEDDNFQLPDPSSQGRHTPVKSALNLRHSQPLPLMNREASNESLEVGSMSQLSPLIPVVRYTASDSYSSSSSQQRYVHPPSPPHSDVRSSSLSLNENVTFPTITPSSNYIASGACDEAAAVFPTLSLESTFDQQANVSELISSIPTKIASVANDFDILNFLDGVLNDKGNHPAPPLHPNDMSSSNHSLLPEQQQPPPALQSVISGLEAHHWGSGNHSSNGCVLEEDDSSHFPCPPDPMMIHNLLLPSPSSPRTTSIAPLVSPNPWAVDELNVLVSAENGGTGGGSACDGGKGMNNNNGQSRLLSLYGMAIDNDDSNHDKDNNRWKDDGTTTAAAASTTLSSSTMNALQGPSDDAESHERDLIYFSNFLGD